MRNLRDFGFGKSSMEEMIRDEFLDMAENLRGMEGQEVESKHLFNVNIMNIIWRMMSGSRSVYLIPSGVDNTHDPLGMRGSNLPITAAGPIRP